MVWITAQSIGQGRLDPVLPNFGKWWNQHNQSLGRHGSFDDQMDNDNL